MAAPLYTPDVLALAVELAAYRLTDDVPLLGEARSTACGSTIVLGLALGDDGRVARVGVRSQACAIGQAAAAIFVDAAAGRSAAEVTAAGDAVAAWLAGEAEIPAWPRLDMIAAAQGYPGRHGAVLLPWRAAAQAFAALPIAR